MWREIDELARRSVHRQAGARAARAERASCRGSTSTCAAVAATQEQSGVIDGPAGRRQGRARRRRHRHGLARGLGPPARDQRRAAGRRDRGPRLPAGRDRGGAVPPRDRARRRRRLRARQGELRRRHPQDRAAARRPGDPAGPDRVTEPAIEVVERPGIDPGARRRAAVARGAADPAAQGHGRLPGHADAARGRPRALGEADRRRPLRRAGARARRLARPRTRRSPAPAISTTSASPGSSRGC